MEDTEIVDLTEQTGKNGSAYNGQEGSIRGEDEEETDSALVPFLLAGILVLAIGAVIVMSLFSLFGH